MKSVTTKRNEFADSLVKLAVLFSFLLAASIAFADSASPWRENPRPAAEVPAELQGVGITEQLGAQIDKSLVFTNELGQPVTLGSFFDGKRPVLLSLVYYGCPGLCNFHLNGVGELYTKLDWTAGQQFEHVVVSIDSSETAELAAEKKASQIAEIKKPEVAKGWHFLVGSVASVQSLAKQVGFGFRWDDKSKQWAHSSALFVLSPAATVSRYLYGISWDPKTVRLSLVEASEGKMGTMLDKLILTCFQYNPDQKGYAFYAYNIMKIGGGMTVLAIAALFLPIWLRERRRVKAQGVVS